jgi:hypothetical protein
MFLNTKKKRIKYGHQYKKIDNERFSDSVNYLALSKNYLEIMLLLKVFYVPTSAVILF